MTDRFLTPRLAGAGVMLVFAVLALYAAITVASALGGHAPGLGLITWVLPLPFYLYALWTAGRTVRQIAAGSALKGLVSPLLRRIGWALFLGGLTTVFAVPLLMRKGSGSYAMFDINAMTLGAVGVTLVIVARLVRDAEADRAELDAFV